MCGNMAQRCRMNSEPCPPLFSRKSLEELDMDKVTAAMVLTSLSTSPLVRSPPVRQNGKPGAPRTGKGPLTSGAELLSEEALFFFFFSLPLFSFFSSYFLITQHMNTPVF